MSKGAMIKAVVAVALFAVAGVILYFQFGGGGAGPNGTVGVDPAKAKADGPKGVDPKAESLRGGHRMAPAGG